MDDRQILAMRKSGVDHLLPSFIMFEEGNTLHFCDRFTDFVPVKKSFLDVAESKPNYCSACFNFKGYRLYRTVSKACVSAASVLARLAELEERADNPQSYVSDVDYLSFEFTSVAYASEPWLAEFSANMYLSSYAGKVAERLQVVSEKMLAYGRTDAMKVLFEDRAERHLSLHYGDDTHLLYSISDLVDFELLAGEVYGTEIISGVYLSRMPARLATMIGNETSCTTVKLPEGVSLEVLKTMASLWEPDAETALGDGNKAYAAAVLLTS